MTVHDSDTHVCSMLINVAFSWLFCCEAFFIANFSFSSSSRCAFWNSLSPFEYAFASLVSITRRCRFSDSCSGCGSPLSSLRNRSVSLHCFRVIWVFWFLKLYYCKKVLRVVWIVNRKEDMHFIKLLPLVTSTGLFDEKITKSSIHGTVGLV